MQSHPRIAITGDIGSGKSAVGRLLTERLGWSFYSTGELQRRIAAQRGMTTLELNRYAESHPEIDREIDSMTESLHENEARPFIIDSRIAWHFIPTAFRVYLRVDPDEAARRILSAGRDTERYATADEAKREVRRRRESEVERFREKYGIDLADLDNFHVVVDTTHAPPEAVADAVVEAFNAWRAGGPSHGLYLSPRQLDAGHPAAASGRPLVGVERR